MMKPTENRIRSYPLTIATILLVTAGGARAEGVDLEAIAKQLQQGDITSQAATNAAPTDKPAADTTDGPAADQGTLPGEPDWRFPENTLELAEYANEILSARTSDPDERRLKLCELIAELQASQPDMPELDLSLCRLLDGEEK